MKKMNDKKTLENKGEKLKLTTLAFTLVELLAVIVILAIVLIIAVPGVLSIINSTKQKGYESQLKMIKDATRTYVTTTENTWKENKLVVNLTDLQSNGLIDKKIIDPRNKKEMTGITIIVTKKGNKMNYDIVYGDSSNANYPVYTGGMIPIVYDGTNWVKADITNENQKWFDYSKQNWANIATVSEDVRSSLLSAKAGTVVPMDKINGMYVWMPKFKYKLFNVDGTISPVGNPNMKGDYTIDVEMEGKDTTSSTGTKNGQWLTHPAFTFGEEKLSGLWIAKFENGYNGPDKETIKNNLYEPENLMIKPNMASWSSQTLSVILKTINFMSQPGNQFGLTSVEDPHLMKNIDWGALTYLTYSNYGKSGNKQYSGAEREVRVNNQHITGCGADVINGPTTDHCNSYETAQGQASSTTGNITGIYDTNGCSWDIVASSMVGSDGKNQLVAESGLTQDELNQLVQGDKYFDRYDYGSNLEDRSRGHLGDATKEMGPFSSDRGAWYSDLAYFLTDQYPSTSIRIKPFFLRGGAVWSNPAIDGIAAYLPWASNTPDDKTARVAIL